VSYYENRGAQRTEDKTAAKRPRSLFSKLRLSALLFWLAFAIFLIGVEAALQGHAGNPGGEHLSGQADMQTLADWITSLQYRDRSLPSYGAIRIHQDAGYYDGQYPYYRVAPYNGNLAVAGLLRAPIVGKLDVAKKWIQWQLNHVDTAAVQGVVFDHWYRADGSGETTCLNNMDPRLCDYSDSFGSCAATFLGAACAYYNAGGSTAFLGAPGNKERFESAAGVILRLQQADGLVSENNSPVKYLMDNSEVYWGLKAMEALEARVYNDRAASQTYARAAARIQNGIRYFLLDPGTGLYRVAEVDDSYFWDADLSTWYPGTVSLVWPSLFSVTAGNSKTAMRQIASLNATWNGTAEPDWTRSFVDPDGFPWASIGYAALLSGNSARARAQANMIKAAKFPSEFNKPGFAWPFPVDDAGWLLCTLSELTQHTRSD
jgi:hypothetical protein